MWMIFVKKVLPLVLVQVFQQLGYFPSAKIRITRTYLQGVQILRFAFLAVLGLGFLFVLSAFALICLALGVYQLLAHDPRLLAMVMLGMGAALSLFVGLCFIWLSSEKRWMEKTGATKMLEDSLRDLERQSPSLWDTIFASQKKSSAHRTPDTSEKEAA